MNPGTQAMHACRCRHAKKEKSLQGKFLHPLYRPFPALVATHSSPSSSHASVVARSMTLPACNSAIPKKL